MLRQIRSVELPFHPAELADAFREVGREPEPLADLLEDPEIRLRFAERLDALVLERDDAMIELLLAVMSVAAESRPLADVEPLEVRASRQDDVGLALECRHNTELIRESTASVFRYYSKSSRDAQALPHQYIRLLRQRHLNTSPQGALKLRHNLH